MKNIETYYHEHEIIRAKEYYYRHIGLPQSKYSYMWGQCSEDYKECWLKMARLDIRDEMTIDEAVSKWENEVYYELAK